jgi:hypothetical protein
MFCYFGDGEYRWNKFFIRTASNGFTVGTGMRNSETGAPFSDAARRAGTTEAALSSWIRRAKALRVYSIERDGTSGVVEVMLEGSEWMPYGLRYAPPEKPGAQESLMFYSKQDGQPGDRALRHLYGPWFYFEGKR